MATKKKSLKKPAAPKVGSQPNQAQAKTTPQPDPSALSIGDLKNLTKKHSPEFEYVYNIFLEKSWEEFCGGRYSELVKNKKDISLYIQDDGHPNDKGNEEWFKHLLKEIK